MRRLYLKKSYSSLNLDENVISNNDLNSIILYAIPEQLEGGCGSSFKLGSQCRYLRFFYALKKVKAVVYRLHSMTGCIRQAQACPLPSTELPHLIQSVAIAVEGKSGGYPHVLGVTVMSVISLLNELKAEVKALRAELAALKAEKSNPNPAAAIPEIQAVQSVQSVSKSQPKPKQDRILRLPEVLKITGFKKTSFYAKLKQGLFNKVKLSERSVGFFESEIYAFVQTLAVVGGAL